MSALTDEWLQQRIDATKALILKVEEGITALSSGAQAYTLDTGQSRQVVQKADIGSLRNMLAELENRLATLDARLNGGGFVGMPGF